MNAEMFFRKKYTKRDIETVRRTAQRLVDAINESKEIAKISENPLTKVSRIEVAKEKLAELKNMKKKFRFVKLYGFGEIELEINEIEYDIQKKDTIPLPKRTSLDSN